MGVDPLGLQEYNPTVDISTVIVVLMGWEAIGFDMSARRAYKSLVNDAQNENAPQAEINALKSSSKFTNVFNDGYFSGIYNQVGLGANYDLGGTDGTNVNYNSGLLASDLGHSYGNLTYSVTGAFDWVTQNGIEGWKTTATFSVSDTYDFNPASNNPAIAAFSRLQLNGFASIYDTNVNFTLTFDEF
jgi:hypothetical protein